MASGIYVHIPYCLQRCPYCDFATYKFDETVPVDNYLKSLFLEIQTRASEVPFRDLDTIYFGGGTPSLLEPNQLSSIISQITSQGFKILPDAEITIEINPGTISDNKIKDLVSIGINRFSVGAQTLSDRLLKLIGRKHNANDTLETLRQLKTANVNYSVDVLFALPTQTLNDLSLDLETILLFSPPHISPYYLTIPTGHPLQVNRPSENIELEMFELMRTKLISRGYEQYEISNFSLPGKHSRHNNLYWQDDSYWGIGLSAHSYFNSPEWGMRFWNPKTMESYLDQVTKYRITTLPIDQLEKLSKTESLTDFCHTFLRTLGGIPKGAVRRKFGETCESLVASRLANLLPSGLVEETNSHWQLSPNGRLLSNQVFSHILFTSDSLDYNLS